MLISLAKGFPVHFLPSPSPPPAAQEAGAKEQEAKKAGGAGGRPQEFWETLLKLDKECWGSRKGKSVVRSHSSVSSRIPRILRDLFLNLLPQVSIKETDDEAAATSLSFSAFGQLLSMLSSPVIKRSSLLTGRSSTGSTGRSSSRSSSNPSSLLQTNFYACCPSSLSASLMYSRNRSLLARVSRLSTGTDLLKFMITFSWIS